MISSEKLDAWLKTARKFGPLLVLLLFCGVVWLLTSELQKIDFEQLKQSMWAIPTGKLLAAGGLTAAYYAGCVLYDSLAARHLEHSHNWWRLTLLGVIARVIGLNFGTIFGASAVRMRFYSAWGFPLAEVVKFIALTAPTFWVGFYALAGVTFLFDPVQLPPDWSLPLHHLWPVGLILLAAVGGYLLVTLRMQTVYQFGHFRFSLPTFRLAAAQAVVSAMAFLVNAGIFYVLLPDEVRQGFIAFVAVFCLTTFTVIISRVPGGLGVVELAILKLLLANADDNRLRAQILGITLVYRGIFYLIPLGIAVLVFLGHECHLFAAGQKTKTPSEAHHASESAKP